jgi:hypothetical protein
VVFGDIGTSPLYALKAVLDVTTENPPTEILGALSLIVWTLIIITSVKYITLAMRVDNDGEGGILALMALLRMRQVQQALVDLGVRLSDRHQATNSLPFGESPKQEHPDHVEDDRRQYPRENCLDHSSRGGTLHHNALRGQLVCKLRVDADSEKRPLAVG